jgi:hypothetical protein
MEILLRLVIVVCVLGLLRTSQQFRALSRDVDDMVLLAVKRVMHVAEESGLPGEVVPILLMLTVLTFMFVVATTPGGR